MACRIQNLGKHRMALDLRGGRIVYLQPNEISQPLREEWLYGNVHIPGWLAQGLVRRMDAKMSDVIAFEAVAVEEQNPAAPAEASDGDAPDAAEKYGKASKGGRRAAAASSEPDKSDQSNTEGSGQPQGQS
jgi:hypothetical protein